MQDFVGLPRRYSGYLNNVAKLCCSLLCMQIFSIFLGYAFILQHGGGVAGGGGESGIEWQAEKKCVRVSITRGMNCESRLFCLFSTAEKLGANSQPSLYSASKATIFSLLGTQLFATLQDSDDVSALPQLRTYAYTSSLFFSALIFVTTASTCCTASASLYGYILLFCC